MIDLQRTPYNSDGESFDACPTCGARVHTKATTTSASHQYRLECSSCSWDLPVERPPVDSTDAELVTDGGTATKSSSDGGPESAREILDKLHSDESVARVAKYVETGDCNITATDLLRTLTLAEDRLCFEIEHDRLTEYVWLDADWRAFVARSVRKRDGEAIGPVLMSRRDMSDRLSKPINVRLVENVPVERPGLGGEE